MIATARYEAVRPAPPAADPASPATAARALARGYLRYVSALWRGERHATAFADWLDRFWCAELPDAPARVPDAISPHGGAGHGIAWFGATGEVRGYIGGVSGGYRVPLAALADLVPSTTGRDTPGHRATLPDQPRPTAPAA